MKKKILWILCPLLASVCLGACEGPEVSETEVSSESADHIVPGHTQETGTEEGGTMKPAPETFPAEREGKEDMPVVLSLVSDSQYDHVWEDGRRLCYVSYSRVRLDDQEEDSGTGAKAFPQLARALEEINVQVADDARESLERLEVQARGLAADGFSGELSWENQSWVVRADSQVTSVLGEGSTYLGGAHGMYWYGAITFDSQSGRKLELEEVVTDPNRLAELAAERLGEKYPDVEFFESVTDVVTEEAEKGDLTWTAGYEGITLYFDPYELAPYSYGALTVTILYEEQPGLFSEKIRQVPDSWAVPLAPGLEFDLGQDKSLDTVRVSGVSGLGSGYEKLRVLVNGQESLTDMWFYSYTPYVVRAAGLDTELLVAETTSDNDYEVIWVYELDPAREGFYTPWQFSGTGFFSYYREKDDGDIEYGTHVFTNPEHFHLRAHMDLLSTYYGHRWYGIGETASRAEGYLVPEQSWYDVDRGDNPLTLLVPLDMELEDTRELREFPAGTKLWIVRVEGNYVGFVTEDGTRCQVYVEPGWPERVRGKEDMEAGDIFDGMMFAG